MITRKKGLEVLAHLVNDSLDEIGKLKAQELRIERRIARCPTWSYAWWIHLGELDLVRKKLLVAVEPYRQTR